jgi:hypothetical protein
MLGKNLELLVTLGGITSEQSEELSKYEEVVLALRIDNYWNYFHLSNLDTDFLLQTILNMPSRVLRIWGTIPVTTIFREAFPKKSYIEKMAKEFKNEKNESEDE